MKVKINDLIRLGFEKVTTYGIFTCYSKETAYNRVASDIVRENDKETTLHWVYEPTEEDKNELKKLLER